MIPILLLQKEEEWKEKTGGATERTRKGKVLERYKW